MTLEVITPAATQELCLLSTLKFELGIADGDTSKDAMLYEVIAQASGRIADACNRPEGFGRERVRQTERVGWPCVAGSGVILERDLNVVIVSVEEAGIVLASNYWVVDAGILYRLDATGTWRWAWRPGLVKVTYDHGYDLLIGLPRALERACLDLCRSVWLGRGRDPSLRSESAEGIGQVSYFDPQPGALGGLPPSISDAIAPWRRPHRIS